MKKEFHMKTIHISGTGCPKCRKLFQKVTAADSNSGGNHTIEKGHDIPTFGEMTASAPVVNGKVVSAGKVRKDMEPFALLKGMKRYRHQTG